MKNRVKVIIAILAAVVLIIVGITVSNYIKIESCMEHAYIDLEVDCLSETRLRHYLESNNEYEDWVIDYVIEHIEVDYNQEAVECVQDYFINSDYYSRNPPLPSYEEAKEQLCDEFSFTEEQAEYALDKTDYMSCL